MSTTARRASIAVVFFAAILLVFLMSRLSIGSAATATPTAVGKVDVKVHLTSGKSKTFNNVESVQTFETGKIEIHIRGGKTTTYKAKGYTSYTTSYTSVGVAATPTASTTPSPTQTAILPTGSTTPTTSTSATTSTSPTTSASPSTTGLPSLIAK